MFWYRILCIAMDLNTIAYAVDHKFNFISILMLIFMGFATVVTFSELS